LRHGRFAIKGGPGSGKSWTLEGYVAWQRSQGREVLVLVRKRKEAEELRSRGVKAFTLQSHRYKALGYPEIVTPDDLAALLEGLQEGEKQFDALAVDEVHNWSPEFFDVARSLWTEGDFICFFDEHQSLMHWAGAVRDLKEELWWAFGVDDKHILHLVNNYRSAPKVVEVLNTVVPREMYSRANVGYGSFHVEKCYNLEDECRFVYNQLLKGYEDVQVLARNSSICRRVSSFLEAKGVKHGLYLAGGEEVEAKVLVQTIFTAQATEHMVVFLLGTCQGILPDYRSPVRDEHNVFYVGCSRAKRDLFIAYHATPSEFLTRKIRRLGGEKVRGESDAMERLREAEWAVEAI